MAKDTARDTGSGKPRHAKLGVKPGQIVAVVGGVDVGSDLETLGAKTGPVAKADWILVAIDVDKDLARIVDVRSRMRSDSAIWCVYVKGRKELGEKQVRETALQGDLVDVKVMSWSDTHSALKLVVRKALR